MKFAATDIYGKHFLRFIGIIWFNLFIHIHFEITGVSAEYLAFFLLIYRYRLYKSIFSTLELT